MNVYQSEGLVLINVQCRSQRHKKTCLPNVRGQYTLADFSYHECLCSEEIKCKLSHLPLCTLVLIKLNNKKEHVCR